MSQIFNDDEFKQLDFNKQKEILSNYFNSELADDEFKALSDSEQSKIKDNFLIKSLSDIGAINPREDGAGFLTRTKFSFADTDKGRKQVLEDEYGKGNAIKVDNRWLVYEGKEKGWNAVDEKSLSWKDIADFAGDTPEMVGGTAGAIAGSGLWSIPLASGGTALGAGAKKLIAKAMGIEDNQTATEVAKDLGTSAALGGIGQGVGLGLVKALAPFKSKMTPDAIARKELAQKYGVELTPAQITQSPSLGMIENGMKNNPASVGTMAKFAEGKQLIPFQEAIKNITPENSSDGIGRAIVDAINSNKNAQKQMFNQQYSDIANQINSPISIDTLINQASNILEQNKNIPKTAQDTAVKIASEILDSQTPNLNYNELSKLRTNLGEMAKSGNVTGDIGTAQYKMLKGALDKDFNSFALNNGLGTQKNDVDTAYRGFKEAFENNTIKGLVGTGAKEPIPVEKVVDSVVNPKEISRLDKVIQATNNNDLAKDAVVSKVIDKSSVSDTASPLFGSNFVSPTRFATQSDIYGNHLSKVGADNVRELGKVAENLKWSDAFLNNSNTAPTLQSTGIAGLVGTIPFYPMSKAYTSEIGRKYLTDGLINPNNKAIKSFGAAFAPMITPSYNQD